MRVTETHERTNVIVENFDKSFNDTCLRDIGGNIFGIIIDPESWKFLRSAHGSCCISPFGVLQSLQEGRLISDYQCVVQINCDGMLVTLWYILFNSLMD